MNEALASYARADIKAKLTQLPETWQLTFKRMYSPKDLNLPIEDVVDRMADDKLDWALTQVQNSLEKILQQKKMYANHHVDSSIRE